MLKLPRFISNNLVLKITSLNAVVVIIRLIISVFIQRTLAVLLGEVGIAKIGQLRNLMSMLSSISIFGTFSGIVKYVSEYRDDEKMLTKLFSTAYVFAFFASIISAFTMFFLASFFSSKLFGTASYYSVFQVLAFIIPFIAVNYIFEGVVSGLSAYKKYAKIELFTYLFSSALLVVSLYIYSLKGVLFAIAITPIVKFIILVSVFGNVLKDYIKFKNLSFKIPLKKQLLAFTLMSFFSTVLLNYVEIDLRNVITNRVSEVEAGCWTAMTFISRNYMVFVSGVLTLYILPKFASIHSGKAYKKEVLHIYKTILPLFAIGMLLIFVLKDYIIQFVYPNFEGMKPLFKWQLLADFVRLASIIIASQFLAKKMIKSFVISELFSLIIFYALAVKLVDVYGTQGIVIANFIRYILYFGLVIVLVWRYYKVKQHRV